MVVDHCRKPADMELRIGANRKYANFSLNLLLLLKHNKKYKKLK
jgi:hypothetical protein